MCSEDTAWRTIKNRHKLSSGYAYTDIIIINTIIRWGIVLLYTFNGATASINRTKEELRNGANTMLILRVQSQIDRGIMVHVCNN